MKTIAVASANPVKLRAAGDGFRRIFPSEDVHPLSVPGSSGVGDQPSSGEETLRGATHRARDAAEAAPEADYWVGIEGGIEETREGMTAFAWVVVLGKDGRVGRGRSGTFFLPERVAGLVRSGKELGEADDIVFGRVGSKQEEGAVGLLTGGAIDRRALYEHATVLALVAFRHPELYGAHPQTILHRVD